MYRRKRIKMLDVGSGSSGLLYSLSLAEVLEFGIGVEVSRSRVKFANSWGKSLKTTKVKNICSDFVKYETKKGYYDLCVCTTGSFLFFYPINKNYPKRVLNKMISALKNNGKIIMEMKTYKHILEVCKKNKNVFKTWIEYEQNNPYRYELIYYTYYPRTKCPDWKEVYVRRDGGLYDKKSQRLKIYDKKELRQLLSKAGFRNINFHSDWVGKTRNMNSDKIIVVAEKL